MSNPLYTRSTRFVTFYDSLGNIVDTIDPSTCKPSIEPVNASGAGRDEDMVMETGLKGYIRKYSLGWNGIDKDDAAAILQLVHAKEFYAVLFDPEDKKYQKRLYYAGPRSCSFKMWNARGKFYSSLTVNIIEVDPSQKVDMNNWGS